MGAPLAGCKVLDFTRVLSGPWCTMMLGDLGADVIKVEDPARGDYTRDYGPPFLDGVSAYFLSYNRGKRSLALNLKHPRGRELVRQLVAKVDVLVHNYTPQFVRKAGLDYGALNEINPGLIYCWISGYGEDGPHADRGATDIMVMGLSGAMSLTGQPNGPPIKSNLSYADMLAGYNAVVGIIASLRVRDQTGRGQKVSVNLLDSAIATLGSLAGNYFATGDAPKRIAPDVHPALSATGTFKTRDGYINVGAARDKEFLSLFQALGLAQVAADPELKTNPGRVKHRKRLRTMLEEVLATKTTSEWRHVLDRAGVMAEPVNTLDQALEHPQVQHNQMVATIQHPIVGPVRVLRTPLKLSVTNVVTAAAPPLLGQHTEEVLEGYLGLSGQELEELRMEGVISISDAASVAE